MCRCRSTTSAIEPAQRRPPPNHPSTMTAPRTLRQQPTARRALAALCGALWLLPSAGPAQSVTLAGKLGSKALLGGDGHPPPPRGGRSTLRLGAPVSVGGRSGSGKRITLIADSRGHFVNSGTINGQVMQFMI